MRLTSVCFDNIYYIELCTMFVLAAKLLVQPSTSLCFSMEYSTLSFRLQRGDQSPNLVKTDSE